MGALIGIPMGSELLVTYPQQSPSESLVGVDKCDQEDLIRDVCNIPSEFDWLYLFSDPEKPIGRRAKHHERH
jgi:hypothetical protein